MIYAKYILPLSVRYTAICILRCTLVSIKNVIRLPPAFPSPATSLW